MLDWTALREAVELLGEKPSVSRVDGVRSRSKQADFKVYRVAGGIIRVDIQPKENHDDQSSHARIQA